MSKQVERFRGSSEIPITEDGIRAAQATAMKLARKGGLDEIQTSSLGRTVHTARIISQYTHAPITYVGDGPHPWHLGGMEGQEVTPERVATQHSLVTEHPDDPVPGRGPLSTADGESFNDFKSRTLDYLQGVLAKSANAPDKRIGVVTHYRVKKLLEAWMRAGAQPDQSIDSLEMIQHNGNNVPGGVDRVRVDPYAGVQMHSVDLDSPARLGGGVYLIRHEKTSWNDPHSTGPDITDTQTS